MAKYKNYDYSQSLLIPVSLKDQLMPGTLEFAIHTLVEERLDVSVFDLINIFGTSPYMNYLIGKTDRKKIKVFGQVSLTHHRTDGTIEIRHQAVSRISLAFPVGRDINNGSNLIAFTGVFEKIAQIKVLDQKIGSHLGWCPGINLKTSRNFRFFVCGF